ncbi:hypothetical protein DAPPUDRAFT_99563 [Daphnia pulex]|uniref:Uncharacterized protein n=1 Tax=Daphnia pulex TaxID=6669 RepID=E9G799_DAPPU|nr:hypothetical protein DAPPUDRAFT_99563 [Daphnia pulex]|eukprot:EFX84432.1 hypothetical protein DAPPUDRAFT_99563 [Daphnia pulex]
MSGTNLSHPCQLFNTCRLMSVKMPKLELILKAPYGHWFFKVYYWMGFGSNSNIPIPTTCTKKIRDPDGQRSGSTDRRDQSWPNAKHPNANASSPESLALPKCL